MSQLVLDAKTTCCFAGYRPHKYGFKLCDDNPEFNELQENIISAVEKSYEDGYRTFLCGGAMGFDLLCAEHVLKLKQNHPDIKLICMLPFEGQAKRFSKLWLEKYNAVLKECDNIEYITPTYIHGCYFTRTEKMITASTRLITYFDGKAGGTDRCIACAQFNHLDIINLSKGTPIPDQYNYFPWAGRTEKM